MSYCLNPVCTTLQNLDGTELCRCGSKLRLKDRYIALKPIGQGGFGRTFLAVDLAEVSKPRCVIKQFFPQNQGTDSLEKAAELFRQEASRLEELGKHSQIPELLDYLEQEGRQYLIQEFVDGRNLEQELAENGAFSEPQIWQLLNDLLLVLQFIHDHQVIHRDVKPANIIRRNADQKLVLVDLGAAKYATGTALARTGTVIGSAEFTAPEQARGKAVFASDLYSLGATCIYLLTQVSPFDLFDGSEDRWVWRDYLSHSVSGELGQVLDKMLQSAMKRRYQSADQVLQDFNFTLPSRLPVRGNRVPGSFLSPYSNRRGSLVSVFEPQTRSWRWDVEIDSSNEAQAALHCLTPDLSFEQDKTLIQPLELETTSGKHPQELFESSGSAVEEDQNSSKSSSLYPKRKNSLISVFEPETRLWKWKEDVQTPEQSQATLTPLDPRLSFEEGEELM